MSQETEGHATVGRSTSGHAPPGQPPVGQVLVGHDAADHEPIEHEKPEDWGWHADFGLAGRIAGWICVVTLLIGVTATHYNDAGSAALLITAGLLVLGLLWDARKRRTSWRR